MTAHIFGGIQGMTDAQVRQAYAAVVAERDALRAALVAMVATPPYSTQRELWDQARAALAQGGEK